MKLNTVNDLKEFIDLDSKIKNKLSKILNKELNTEYMQVEDWWYDEDSNSIKLTYLEDNEWEESLSIPIESVLPI